MPPVAGNDAAAEKRIAPVQVPFLHVDPESLWILEPVFFDPPTAAAFDPFFMDAFEMAVRRINPVIQKSGHAEDQRNQHHPDPRGSLIRGRNPGKSFLGVIHCAMKT